MTETCFICICVSVLIVLSVENWFVDICCELVTGLEQATVHEHVGAVIRLIEAQDVFFGQLVGLANAHLDQCWQPRLQFLKVNHIQTWVLEDGEFLEPV